MLQRRGTYIARTFVKVVQEPYCWFSCSYKALKGKSGNMQADPAQHFVHISAYEELVNLMGPVDTSINYQTPKGGPALNILVGLQGAGKPRRLVLAKNY